MNRVVVYDTTAHRVTVKANLTAQRWYPTALTLPDGSTWVPGGTWAQKPNGTVGGRASGGGWGRVWAWHRVERLAAGTGMLGLACATPCPLLTPAPPPLSKQWPKAQGADIFNYAENRVQKAPLNKRLWDASIGNW